MLRRKLGLLGMSREGAFAVCTGLVTRAAGAWYMAPSLVDWVGGSRSPKSFSFLFAALPGQVAQCVHRLSPTTNSLGSRPTFDQHPDDPDEPKP